MLDICTGLLCAQLPFITNHAKSSDHFMPLYNRMITQVLGFVWALWPWLTINTDIRLYNLVVSMINPSLKETGSPVTEHKPLPKGLLDKHHPSTVPSAEYWSCKKKFCMSFKKPMGHSSTLNFIQINYKTWEKMSAEVFVFSYTCDLEWKSKPFKLLSKHRA